MTSKRDEFLNSLPPDARERALHCEAAFLSQMNKTVITCGTLIRVFEKLDLTDAEIWLALAYLKGSMRAASALKKPTLADEKIFSGVEEFALHRILQNEEPKGTA